MNQPTELTIQLDCITESEAGRIILDALQLYEGALLAALYERDEWWSSEIKATRKLIATLDKETI